MKSRKQERKRFFVGVRSHPVNVKFVMSACHSLENTRWDNRFYSVWSVEGVLKYTSEDCIGGQLCQKVLVLLQNNHASIRTQHLVTIGAKYTAVMDGKGIPARDNLNVDSHPFWSLISLTDVASDGAQFNDLIWLDPAI